MSQIRPFNGRLPVAGMLSLFASTTDVNSFCWILSLHSEIPLCNVYEVYNSAAQLGLSFFVLI